eukprot:7384694-Prymnesium_polylepis.1
MVSVSSVWLGARLRKARNETRHGANLFLGDSVLGAKTLVCVDGRWTDGRREDGTRRDETGQTELDGTRRGRREDWEDGGRRETGDGRRQMADGRREAGGGRRGTGDHARCRSVFFLQGL